MTTEGDSRTRIVVSWLRDDASENAERVLLRALDEVETTAQRRPLWPVRRFSEMSTTARLLVAAALVALGVAGTALVVSGGIGLKTTNAPSVPTAPPPTGTPGTTATTAAAAALAEFTACVPTNAPASAGTTETEVIPGPNGEVTVERTRGRTWRGTITATDPRFSGTHYFTAQGNTYLLPPNEEGQESVADGHRIENDEGAWQGWAPGASLADGTSQQGPVFLTGEGAYDGLSAVLLDTDGSCLFNFRGVVMDVPDPPVSYTGN